MAHAKLSPSASARWMTCPGSVHLINEIQPKNTSSIYADRGTACHTVAEKCLSGEGLDPVDFQYKTVDGIEMDETLIDITKQFVDYVRGIEGVKFFEQRVSLRGVIDNCFGTADVVVIDGTRLEVIDLKTGTGVKVDAEENTQLMCYALGAVLKFQDVYDIETVSLQIIQPPLNNFVEWIVPVERLTIQFADELRDAVRTIEEEPNAFVPSDKACKFCAVAAHCPVMQSMATEAAVADFEEIKEEPVDERVETLASWLDKIPRIKEFITAVENEAKDRLLDGHAVPNYKVVEGRGTRYWNDVAKAQRYFKRKVGKENHSLVMTEPKKPELVSPAQIEKALKKLKIEVPETKMAELVGRKSGNPTVVPESDSRQPISPTSQAQEDFAEVEDDMLS